MAINKTEVHTQIQTPELQTTPDMAALKALLAGSQAASGGAEAAMRARVEREIAQGRLAMEKAHLGQEGQRIQQSEDNATRGDTEAVNKTLSGLTKEDMEKIKASQVAMAMLKDPNVGNQTMLRDKLGREATGGRVPIEMVNAILGPSSLKEKAVGTLGGLLGHPEWNPLTQDQRETYIKNLQNYTQPSVDNIARAQKGITAAGTQLAPTLARRGTLPQVMNAFQGNVGDTVKQLGDTGQSALAAAHAQPSATDQAKSGLASIFGGLMGGGKAGTAAAAPAAGKIRVRDKTSGQTGTLDAAEYDPSKYDKI